MQIINIGAGADLSRWDAYVGRRAGTVLDLAAWRLVLDDAYGIDAHFIAATENDTIVGTLGLFEVRHPLFGHYLTTAMYGSDGGLYFDTPAARDALIAEAKELAVRLKVDYLSIRTRALDLHGFQVDRGYSVALVDLQGGASAAWDRLPGKTRNQVRRGMKEGFSLETGPAQLDAFYDVFHEHMRDLGSPAHSRRYYQKIVTHLGHCSDFMVLRDGQEAVAGALLFWINGTAANLHTVALRRFNKRCPNYLLYWNMMEASIARGCHTLDMGRSKADSSNMQFKENWAPTEVALHYNYFMPRGKPQPDLDPRNAKYRLAIAMWQKLPLAVTKQLGPRLITGLG